MLPSLKFLSLSSPPLLQLRNGVLTFYSSFALEDGMISPMQEQRERKSWTLFPLLINQGWTYKRSDSPPAYTIAELHMQASWRIAM